MRSLFIDETTTLLGRSLRHVVRSPDTVITTAVTPIVMLLMFVYVFGGAVDTGGDRYVDYLLPGILLITVASGVAYTALRLHTDVASGIFERFQTMPIARSAILWGHVVTSLVANLISLVLVVLVAVAIGFRSGAGILAWSAVIGIVVLFTLALTWLAVIPGLTATSPDGAGAFAYPLLFLPFVSIDMVTASILMSMGMMMLPPVTISLPFKIIFFVLVDGWYLITGSLIRSFDPAAAPLPPG